jgi:uncharacterized protein (DUF362 family)
VIVAEEALDTDLFIGLPKVKAHKQMFMTLAVKNTYGIVKGLRKALCHMTQGTHRQFAELILQLPELLPPQLHLADGIMAMHRSGPLDGDPLDLGLVAASASPVALDRALLAALELSPQDCPISRVAAAQQKAGASFDDLYFPHCRPDAFQGSGFIAPEALTPVRFNPFRLAPSLFKRFTLGQA